MNTIKIILDFQSFAYDINKILFKKIKSNVSIALVMLWKNLK